MTEKLGKAGRFYSLTPKAHKFIEDLQKWCAERGIKKEEIHKFLLYVVDVNNDVEWEMTSWGEARKQLVEKGYLEEEAEAE